MSKPKKIRKIAMLSIHSSPVGDLGSRDTGGMSVYIRELAGELGRFGIAVDLFTLCRDRQPSFIAPLDENVRLIGLALNTDQTVTKENLFDYLPLVLQSFDAMAAREKLKYDLIHSHYWLSGVLGQQIKQERNVLHVHTFHTLGAVKNRACDLEREPDFRIKQEKELAGACDRVIASTQTEKQDLVSVYHADPANIGVVAPGMNPDIFHPMDKAHARAKLGLVRREQVLLFVGRHVPVKGLDRLLKILPVLNGKQLGRNRFRLLVIGGEDESAELRDLIRELNISNTVTLIGRKDQKALSIYYNVADMLVVPSYHESFCLAGLEALACGTPVVAMPVGGLRDMINEQNGYVTAENNERQLGDAIMRVADIQRWNGFDKQQVRNSVLGRAWKTTAEQMTAEYRKASNYNANGKGSTF